MKKFLILLILIFPSLSAFAESKDWNKKNVLELCGGISSVSPFIGDRGKILSIKVKKKPLKTATFKVLSGVMVVTSTCELKEDGIYMKTDSIKPY